MIIKGTVQWKGGGKGYEPISEAMLQQMTGRAGRPQFNERGVAVILTSEDSVAKWVLVMLIMERYQEIEGIHEVIESNLTENIIECINNEIVLRSITDSVSLFQVFPSSFHHH